MPARGNGSRRARGAGRRLRRVPGLRRELAAAALVRDLWARRVLRQLAGAARVRAPRADRAPLVLSLAKDEDWAWCFADEVFLVRATPAADTAREPGH